MKEIKIGMVWAGDLERVTAFEQLPIDSLWTGGHVASRNPSTEPLMTLSRLSAVTKRVKIGTSILPLPLYSPAIVAKQIADLDRASFGRIILGVGVGGEYPEEFRACQISRSERGRRTDEAIPLLRRLWTAREISHHGRFYTMEDVKIHPAPVQPGGPPIVVAGRKEPAMRRAALLGDGWMPYMYSPNRYARSVAMINRLATEAGRSLTGFDWYAWVFVNVNADGEVARRQAAVTMGDSYNQDFRNMIDSVAVAGTSSEVTRKLQDFVDAGARHFILMPAAGDGDAEDLIARLFDEVVPSVASA